MSAPEDELELHLRCNRIEYDREARFDSKRRWRIDFLIGDLAVEVEGGVWSGGRHTRGSGFLGDMEKYNALTMAGYRILRFTPQMVKQGIAIKAILKAIEKDEQE